MPSEINSWIISSAGFLLSVLFGVIWNFTRLEIRELKQQNEQKVDNNRFLSLESKFNKDLEDMKDNSERLIDKLQSRHDKDLDAMQSNFREQMTQIREQVRASETNILNQMNLLFKSNQGY